MSGPAAPPRASFSPAIVRAVLTLFAAVVSFYVGCFTYRLAAQLFYTAAVAGMMVLHVFNGHPALLQWLVVLLDFVRNANVGMYAAGVLAAAAALILVPQRLGSTTARSRAAMFAVIPLLAVIALCADLILGITPLSEWSVAQRPYNADGRHIDHRFSVEQIMHMEDRLSGAHAEVEGTLEFDPRMQRFKLLSPAGAHHSVYVFFFKGRRSMFSELKPDDKPRYYDQVAPLIGKPVRIFGTCVNGQIDADIADVETIAEFTPRSSPPPPSLQPI